jgi:hypothetical protein
MTKDKRTTIQSPKMNPNNTKQKNKRKTLSQKRTNEEPKIKHIGNLLTFFDVNIIFFEGFIFHPVIGDLDEEMEVCFFFLF